MRKLNGNELFYPNYNNRNIVDIARVIYNYCGKNFMLNHNMRELKKYIKNDQNIILILVDGLGYNIIKRLSNNSILKRNCKGNAVTVFPSATGCVLNSLITAEYPSKTGLFGWYSYNREKEKSYYTLLLKDRITNEDIELTNDEIFKKECCFNKMNRSVNVIYPLNLLETRYSKYVIGNNKSYGYSSYNEAFDIIGNHVIKNNEKTFTYLYLPEIDTLEHRYGLNNSNVFNKINELEMALEEFTNKNDNFEIVLIADHGQTNINKVVTMDFDKYNKYFYALPSIDLGTATYFVKYEYRMEFIEEFKKDYNNSMIIYDTKDLISADFFGKNISKHAKDCLGEYTSICKKGYAFYNMLDKYDDSKKINGNHTGLTKDEMEIPIIVIKK